MIKCNISIPRPIITSCAPSPYAERESIESGRAFASIVIYLKLVLGRRTPDCLAEVGLLPAMPIESSLHCPHRRSGRLFIMFNICTASWRRTPWVRSHGRIPEKIKSPCSCSPSLCSRGSRCSTCGLWAASSGIAIAAAPSSPRDGF